MRYYYCFFDVLNCRECLVKINDKAFRILFNVSFQMCFRFFSSNNISQVELDGVAVAHEKHSADNETESKGVKAHFRMDESGVLNLDSVSLD